MQKRSNRSTSQRSEPSRGGNSRKPSRPANGRNSQRGPSMEVRGPKSSGSFTPDQKKNSDVKEIQKRFPRLVAGHHAVVEAIKKVSSGDAVLWLSRTWESSKDLRELEKEANSKKIQIEIKPDEALKAAYPGNQGACLFVKTGPKWELSNVGDEKYQTLLILDGVEDPHNLGAILRTSWLLGVSAVVIPQDRAVGLTPTVHKVACGGAEYVPVVTVPNLAQFNEEAKKIGFWVFGLSHKAEKEIHQVKFPERMIWVLGAEDSGMRVTTERVCDELVKLPQLEKSASFNVSNAAAMALFETARQKSSS
ncbi:MAG: 23S rRNA (guanosine(2251)-2'-O)-methyltransferase RlmB [Bdellovibrionota bacterium]